MASLGFRDMLQWHTKALFVLSVPLFLLSGALRVATHSQRLYEYSLDRYQASRTTGVPRDELARATRELIAYFGGTGEAADILVTVGGEERALFNEREVAHLRDVRDLVRLNDRVLLASLATQVVAAAALGVLEAERALASLARASTVGAVLTVVMVGLTGVVALADWDAIFLQFHLASFSNDLWRLDPARDNLILMFPPPFFLRATLLVAALSIGGALLVVVASRWYLRRRGMGAAGH